MIIPFYNNFIRKYKINGVTRQEGLPYYNIGKISELIKEFFGYPIQTAYSLAGDLINWKLYGNSVQRILPEGYTQLEYIGSTGTQYIDTGINGTTITRFKIKGFCAPYGSSNTQLIGGTLNSATSFYGSRILSGTASWYALNSAGQPLVPSSHWAEADITIVSTSSQTGTIKDIDTNETFEVAKVASSLWGFPNENLLIFGGDAGRRSPNAEVSHLELYTSQGLVRDYIPAKRNSDNEVGMYDLVTNTFKPNAGTGSFVAGPVAPTPSAPNCIIDIKSVGDRTKNLFDKDTMFLPHTVVNNSSTGTLGRSSAVGLCAYFPIESGKTYTVSRAESSTNSRFACCLMKVDPSTITGETAGVLYKEDGVNYGYAVGNNTSVYSMTFTPQNPELKYALIYLSNGSVSTSYVVDLQAEQGSTPTSYIPYGYQIPVTIGSNCGVVDLGTLSWVAHPTANVFYASIGNKFGGITNLYTGKYEISSAGSSSVQDKHITGHTGQFIYIKDTDYIDATAFKQAMSGVYLYYQRTTDEEFTPPTTTPIYLSNPLRKVGTYADYIDYENQQVVRNVGVKVFDGTESWSSYTYGESSLSFYISINDMIETAASTSATNFSNTHFQWVSGLWGKSDTGYAVSTMKRMFFRRNTTDTLDTWKAWLASEYANNTPVIIEYPLATPVTESLTVPALTMATGTNLITAETEIKPSDMFCRGRVSQL